MKDYQTNLIGYIKVLSPFFRWTPMSKKYDEDDKPTVVIDLAALKKSKSKLNEIDDLGLEIEFVTDSSYESSAPKLIPKNQYLFFNFKQDVPRVLNFLPSEVSLTTHSDLTALNSLIKEKKPLVVFFYFEQNPKGINQLCAQIKAKFKHVKTILITQNLAPEKKNIHQSSPAGAYEYITTKTTTAEMLDLIRRIESTT